jgi:hypothetical protein
VPANLVLAGLHLVRVHVVGYKNGSDRLAWKRRLPFLKVKIGSTVTVRKLKRECQFG